MTKEEFELNLILLGGEAKVDLDYRNRWFIEGLTIFQYFTGELSIYINRKAYNPHVLPTYEQTINLVTAHLEGEDISDDLYRIRIESDHIRF